MEKPIRLDKYLADMGIGSRSEIKLWIRKGSVCVNNEICKKPELKVYLNQDQVTFDGREILYHQFSYYMLYKPAGVVSATTDSISKTVMDLLQEKEGKDLFPVGRLDKDTEGLLLITNDGDLAHRLLSPKKHVDKVYYARVKGKVTKEDADQFLAGVSIETDDITLPAKLTILSSGIISEIELTIQEGKFHQVKRMFEAVGKEVLYLKRLSMGGLALDQSLLPGEYRKLREDEISYLQNINIKEC